MAPKRSTRSSTKKEEESKESGDKRKHDEVEQTEDETAKDSKSCPSSERSSLTRPDDSSETKPKKEENDSSDEPPAKTSRKSSALEWLLSAEAFNMANPQLPEGHGEIDWDESDQRKTPPKSNIDKDGKETDKEVEILRYPQSRLTPFQNLVSASILSKPLSHKLGLRTIQTLLNPPFTLRTVKDLDEAGFEGRRKVMWEARTQHKEKTASLLGDLCEGIKELCGEDEQDLSDLTGVREKIAKAASPKEAQDQVIDILTEIKGIGPGVASIFLRRVQADWEEVFPYIDDRSLKAAGAFGIVDESGSAEDGADQLKIKVNGDREKYVRLVDVLVGLELEKKVDEAMSAAGV